ncbi:MAG: xylose isomerase, partial [Gammaproteobacteria bacterium]|nr:xylose isomerase [Gammaproteobacteria bacterium]
MSFFKNVEPIKYLGPDSNKPLSFRYYNPEQKVLNKTMAEHLNFAVCYWHSFAAPGDDVFGDGTWDRPWEDSLDGARDKLAAAFEFFTKLSVPYYCFHDRDVAPEGSSAKETAHNLATMGDELAKAQDSTGIQLLWGTANLFGHPRYAAGAATNPDPEVFAYAASQVKQAMDLTNRLGGKNYVLWGGREGYDTLLNTD